MRYVHDDCESVNILLISARENVGNKSCQNIEFTTADAYITYPQALIYRTFR